MTNFFDSQNFTDAVTAQDILKAKQLLSDLNYQYNHVLKGIQHHKNLSEALKTALKESFEAIEHLRNKIELAEKKIELNRVASLPTSRFAP